MRSLLRTLVLGSCFFCWYVSPCWSVEVGELLPDFRVQTLDGGTLSSGSMSGKPVLLIFWNTWCPNCMKEIPAADRLAEAYAARGLELLAINTGINDSERKAREYWDKKGYRFPSGFDQDMLLVGEFGVRGVPTVFLADANGVVLYKQPQLPENLDQLLPPVALMGAAGKR